MSKSPSQLNGLLDNARLKHFPKGQIIHYEGDAVQDVYVVKSGVVKIYDLDDQGNEKILHIVKTPALVPFAFFSGQGAVTKWFYGALTDCDIYTLDNTTLRNALQHDGWLASFLMEQYSKDVHELLVRLSSLGKTSVRPKLLAVLQFLAAHHTKHRPSGWLRVRFPTNHQFLADMIGVTRESVSSVMKALQDEGVIRNPRLATLEISQQNLTEAIQASRLNA